MTIWEPSTSTCSSTYCDATLLCLILAPSGFQGRHSFIYTGGMKTSGMKKTDKDRRTLEAIGRIYCRGNHADVKRDAGGMCPECREAIEQTLVRVSSCPHGHEGNCQDCETHCQRGEAQARIKAIMKYAAPRMALRHPIMTIEYLRKKSRS